MDIDIYQACPCHSGKKIKFCCGKEIVADLNQILTLHRSKQSIAALEHVDRTISKSGARDSLLAIKTHLLIELNRFDDATELNGAFLASQPQNPVGHEHRALILAAENDPLGAISALQDALDCSPVDEIPMSMANTFRTIGMMLVSLGEVISGRAHLMFASDLREDGDELAVQLILQTLRSPRVPLLLRHEFAVPTVPVSEPWAKMYNNARLYAFRGRWRSAALRADHLLKKFPEVPEILRAKATWYALLGNVGESRAAWEALSELKSVAWDGRAEALLMSWLLLDEPETESYEVVNCTFEIEGTEAVVGAATANGQLVRGVGMARQFIDPEAPPPIAGYLLLDKEQLTSVDEETADFPQVIGEVLVFGKQTDREARLEFICVRDENFDQGMQTLRGVLGEHLSGQAVENVPGQVSKLDHAMSFRWHLPGDATMEQQRALVTEQRKRELFEIWPTIPFNVLGGKTPNEVADAEEHRLALTALVFKFEQLADSQMYDDSDLARLRDQLNVPHPVTLAPGETDVASLSPVAQQRLNFHELDDPSLMKVYVSASTIGNFRTLRRCAPELLDRPDLEKFVQFESVWANLARITIDDQEALECIQRARQHAKNAGRSQGSLLVEELDLRIERGLVDPVPELLRTIRTAYAENAEVQYHLANVLARYGLIDAEGNPRATSMEPTVDPSAAAPTAQGIWTPDAAQQPVTADGPGGSQTKSKLWLPD